MSYLGRLIETAINTKANNVKTLGYYKVLPESGVNVDKFTFYKKDIHIATVEIFSQTVDIKCTNNAKGSDIVEIHHTFQTEYEGFLINLKIV